MIPSSASRPVLNPAAALSSEGAENKISRRRQLKETRAQMLERLTNPLISLHEASVLLKVCPATVRHYSDDGSLPHQRTAGGQRRFCLRDVLHLMRERETRQRETRSRRGRARPPRGREQEARLLAARTSAARLSAPRTTIPPHPVTPTTAPRSSIGARPPANERSEAERASALLLRAGLRNARRS